MSDETKAPEACPCPDLEEDMTSPEDVPAAIEEADHEDQ